MAGAYKRSKQTSGARRRPPESERKENGGPPDYSRGFALKQRKKKAYLKPSTINYYLIYTLPIKLSVLQTELFKTIQNTLNYT
jgi:hypothetical protein